jgi:serine phosphatase RsbU (regulator of sigma subunit)/PAS domain-containing protein
VSIPEQPLGTPARAPGVSGDATVTDRTPAADAPPDAGTPVGRLAATVERLRSEVRAAQATADGRALIELAKGVLVERLGCGPAQAARHLVTLADKARLTPLELAADIVNEAARDHVSRAAADFLQHAAGDTAAPGPSAAVRLRTAESGVLAAGDTPAMAHALLDNALRPLGACAVALWTAAGDGSFALSGSAGLTSQEADRWHYVPPGVPTLARRALQARELVVLDSLADTAIPCPGRLEWPQGGRMAVPAGTGGRLHGVLEICWPGPLPAQSPQTVRQIEALAELCGHTLESRPSPGAPPAHPKSAISELVELTEGLNDPALVLTPHLTPGGHLADFRIRHLNRSFTDPAGRPPARIRGALLLEAYPLAAEEQGLYERIERVHATGEPFRTPRMGITALVDEISLTTYADISITRHGEAVILIWRIQDETLRLASLLHHAQRLGRIGAFEENLTTGDIVWNSQLFDLYGRRPTAPLPLRDLTAHAHPDDAATIDRFLHTVFRYRRPATAAFRLQRTDGITRHIRVIAEPVLDTAQRITIIRGAYQDISSQHWTEVALHATRDQLAHSEAESEERNRLALQLQHAIMPPTQGPLTLTGLSVAVRYRPAATDALVGGDWYDSVVLPSRQILLCVGDIAGHGMAAATHMVVLRNALRGLAVTGAAPGQLLTWLNLVAHHLAEHITATAVCGLYDPDTRILRWARAGHLPPVLVRAGKARSLPLHGGLLLGAVPDITYQEEEIRLLPGDTLLMYSDGLVERRDLALDDSLTELLNAAAGPDRPLGDLLDHLLTHSRSDTDDDTCLIGIRVT